jgi:hypothetical protein
MPFPRVFEPVGTLADLLSIWAHFTFTDPPKPVKCHRCSKSFPDGNGITRDLATSLSELSFDCGFPISMLIIDATIFCRRCYVPYMEYLDKTEDTPDERIPIEQFIEERDSKIPFAEEDKQQCRNDTSSTLVIVTTTAPNPPDAPCDVRKQPKAAQGSSPKRPPAVAPFPHIAEGMRSVAQLGTLVATDAPMGPRDDDSLSPSSPSRSPSPAPSGLIPRIRSSHLFVGAGIVRAAGIGMHMAIRPTSEPAEGSIPRPKSPSPSHISETTLVDSASTR